MQQPKALRQPIRIAPTSGRTLLAVALAALSCQLMPTTPARAQPAKAAQEDAIQKIEGAGETIEGTVRITRDVAYGSYGKEGRAGEKKLLLDVYAPTSAAKNRPAVLLVHGGAWAFGDKGDNAPVALRLAQLGYVALSINYRLASPQGNKYPAQLDDAQRAVRWTRAHALALGIDGARLGALGDSAGGHLVSLLGTRETRDNGDAELAAYSSRVACVVDLYGPADLTQATVGEGRVIVENFLGRAPEAAPELYREASPRFHIDKSTVPFLILQGLADPLVPPSQSQILEQSLHAAGIEATLVQFEGEGHGFRQPATLERVAALTVAFLGKQLGPGQP